MQTRRPRTVGVIGAGIAGLVAARRLARAGVRVVVWEATDRVGGQVETVQVAPGVHVDVGAEAIHLSAAPVAGLVDELGLRPGIVTAAAGRSALLTRRGLRPLPDGVGPAGPSRLGPVLRSGTLGMAGLARAALEPVAARHLRPLAHGEDVSVGDFVTARLGHQVTDTFVDPLLGNLHGGDVHALSLRACAAGLVPAAAERRSLVLRRRTGPAPTMSFATWPDGLDVLTAALVADSPGTTVHTAAPVTALAARTDGGYEVSTAAGPTEVDAVVLAVPGPVAAKLLVGVLPAPLDALAGIEGADVVTALVALPSSVAGVLSGSGLLVPSTAGRLLKAATYLSHKWPHLSSGPEFWVRLSAGRAGDRRVARLSDDELLGHLLEDLRDITGMAADATTGLVRRWPGALPQLTVGHPARLAAARETLPVGITLAGACYDGLGIASCVRSGEVAAAALLDMGEMR